MGLHLVKALWLWRPEHCRSLRADADIHWEVEKGPNLDTQLAAVLEEACSPSSIYPAPN